MALTSSLLDKKWVLFGVVLGLANFILVILGKHLFSLQAGINFRASISLLILFLVCGGLVALLGVFNLKSVLLFSTVGMFTGSLVLVLFTSMGPSIGQIFVFYTGIIYMLVITASGFLVGLAVETINHLIRRT